MRQTLHLLQCEQVRHQPAAQCLSYRYWKANAVNSDTELVGRLAVVVVGQILHELRQVHSRFRLLLSEHAKVLNREKKDSACVQNRKKSLD